MAIDEDVKKQKRSGEQIQKLLKNYTKTGKKLRTEAFVNGQLARLEEYYQEFAAREEEIQNSKGAHTEHVYFKANFHEDITKVYNHMKNLLAARLEKLQEGSEDDNDDTDDNDSDKGETKQDKPSVLQTNGNDQQFRFNKQKAFMAAMLRIIDGIENDLTEPRSSSYYTFKSKILDDYWLQISTLHSEILGNVSQEDKQTEYIQDNIYQDVEDSYHKTAIQLHHRLEELHRDSSNRRNIHRENGRAEHNVSTPKINLPQINVPEFNGSYLQWKTFYDLFTQLIHNRPELGNAQKMYYLKANLNGEPLKLIQHLQTTDENYESAWKILCQRYNNVRLLASNQIRYFLNQPNLDSESARGIKRLHDTTRECLLALNNLGVDTASWDPIIIHILTEKLDKETHRLYEQQITSPKELQTLDNLFTFLEGRFQTLESIGTKINKRQPLTQNKRPQERGNFRSYFTKTDASCKICMGEHKIFICRKFLSMTPNERVNAVKKNEICINCLQHGHDITMCKSQKTCRICKAKHNTMLHNKGSEERNTNTNHQSTSEVKSCQARNLLPKCETLLATTLIKVFTKKDESTTLRALVDQGSQSLFITEDAAQKLRLKKSKIFAKIAGIGSTEAEIARSCVDLQISSIYDIKQRITLSALVLRKLTKVIPNSEIKSKMWKHLNNLPLADPTFNKPGNIDVILGADVFGKILEKGVIKGKQGTPIAQKTVLGWILSGKIHETTSTPSREIISFISQTEIDQQLRRFWELEAIESKKSLTKEEKHCEEMYQHTVQRNNKGRYIVHLPLLEDKEQTSLGESRKQAIARLLQMENKFKVDKSLASEYKKFMKEYQQLGHMKLVQQQTLNRKICYLPHHAVKKEDSVTTKLRVVFDASAKTSTGVALNDIMMTGPTIQQNLLSIVLRWRKHRIVFTADIEKMYRQIIMSEEHQSLQRILWRESNSYPIREYDLTTVTYGTKAAPYLAIRTLHQLSKDEQLNYPIASKILTEDFYVDDVLSGCDSTAATLRLQIELINILKSAGFVLRKWASNSQKVMENVPQEMRSIDTCPILTDETVKALGIHWSPSKDILQFKVNLPVSHKKPTKRTILSEISTLFDPLGWIAPIIITGKILLQELWLAGISWDETLPDSTEKKWLEYRKSLQQWYKNA